ncbi:MAG: type II toxin-antitoxin system HicA family toxin [Rivularia sp. ALOHA_DT_140]|nr:type II toxin-antitoxin system HicA family toxin [Rivularia sp. ALOHA_DT_140]
MSKLPALTGDAVIKTLEKIGFETVRQKGSHVRMLHTDGRVVTVPIHSGKTIGKGLLSKIIRDAEISRDEFIELI